MFELYFGIFWLCFTIPIGLVLIIPLVLSGAWFLLIPFSLYFVIMGGTGILLLRKGIQHAKRNKTTDMLGTLVYGIILDMGPTGNYINNCDELKARVALLTDDGGHTTCEEVVGTHPLYDIGQIIVVQYYQDDINFKGCADMHEIPIEVKDKLLDIYDKYSLNHATKDFHVPQRDSGYIVKESDNVVTTYNY